MPSRAIISHCFLRIAASDISVILNIPHLLCLNTDIQNNIHKGSKSCPNKKLISKQSKKVHLYLSSSDVRISHD